MTPPSWQVVVLGLGLVAIIAALMFSKALDSQIGVPMIAGIIGWLTPNRVK